MQEASRRVFKCVLRELKWYVVVQEKKEKNKPHRA